MVIICDGIGNFDVVFLGIEIVQFVNGMVIFIDFVIFYFGIDYILDFTVIELDVGELFVVVFEKFILEGRFIVVVVELKFLVIVE